MPQGEAPRQSNTPQTEGEFRAIISRFRPEITSEDQIGVIEFLTPDEANTGLHPGWMVLTQKAIYLATQAVAEPDGPVIGVYRMPLANTRLFSHDPTRTGGECLVSLHWIPDDKLAEVDSTLGSPHSFVSLIANHDPQRSKTIRIAPGDRERLDHTYQQAVQSDGTTDLTGSQPPPPRARVKTRTVTDKLDRDLGADPESGRTITLRNGRFGPYVWDGETTASLEREDEYESVTLERAVELLNDRLAAPFRIPTRVNQEHRTLGEDPATGRRITLRIGRFGPYVSDGETNASLRADDDIESINVARAGELLAARRKRLESRPGNPVGGDDSPA